MAVVPTVDAIIPAWSSVFIPPSFSLNGDKSEKLEGRLISSEDVKILSVRPRMPVKRSQWSTVFDRKLKQINPSSDAVSGPIRRTATNPKHTANAVYNVMIETKMV